MFGAGIAQPAGFGAELEGKKRYKKETPGWPCFGHALALLRSLFRLSGYENLSNRQALRLVRSLRMVLAPKGRSSKAPAIYVEGSGTGATSTVMEVLAWLTPPKSASKV